MHEHSTSLTVRAPASVIGSGSGAEGRYSHQSLHSSRGQPPPLQQYGSSSSARSHVSSRARRYNRSHAGGGGAATFVPQNEFPVFSHSGDVEIVVRVPSGRHENRYLLHRHTLTRCSGFFEASTSNEWSRATTLTPTEVTQQLTAGPGAGAMVKLEGDSGGGGGIRGGELARLEEKSGRSSEDSTRSAAMTTALVPPRKRWRYELDHGTGDADIPMLVQKEETSPTTSRTTNFTSSNSIFGGAPPLPPSSGSNRHSKTASSSSFFRSVANLSLGSHHHDRDRAQVPPPTPEEEDLLRDYDNLFRIMYNYPPLLDGVNIADAYVQCKSLLTLADQYDALAVVGPRVDHHLLQFQSRLWKQIAKYPISYLRLGYLARSKIIFQEALIHVVGQWPAGENVLRAALPEAVMDIIEDKVDELEETVGRIEGRLFRLTLTTRGGERVSPLTSLVDWLAVTFFRDWLVINLAPPITSPPIPERTRGAVSAGLSRDSVSRSGGRSGTAGSASSGTVHSNGRPPPPPLSGHAANTTQHLKPILAPIAPLANLGRTYRTIGSGGPNYLGHDECKRFLKQFPDQYSRDNLRRFEKRIEEMKAMACEVVRPLMGSALELEMGPGRTTEAAAAIGYLTCTSLVDRDLPWPLDD